MKIAEYIETRLRDQVDYHKAKSRSSQSAYRRLQALAITLGALTPLLLAFNLLFAPPAKVLSQYIFTLMPIVAAVGATVAQSFLATYRYKDTWRTSRATKEALDQELYLYELGAGPYATSTEPDVLLVERAEALIGNERETWLSVTGDRDGGGEN